MLIKTILSLVFLIFAVCFLIMHEQPQASMEKARETKSALSQFVYTEAELSKMVQGDTVYLPFTNREHMLGVVRVNRADKSAMIVNVKAIDFDMWTERVIPYSQLLQTKR